jgi:hypothetical protein
MAPEQQSSSGHAAGAQSNGTCANGRASGFAGRATGGGPSLGEFFDAEVRPRLTADIVFMHPSHGFKADGAKLRGGCPWHDSKSGTSFYVDTRTLAWRCPACQAGGGPLQYLHRLAGGAGASPRAEDFVRVVRRACELAGVPFPEHELSEEEKERARRKECRRAVLATVIFICQERLWSPAGEPARAYLAGRGFDERTLEDLGLGLYPHDLDELRRQLLAAGHDRKDVTESTALSKKMCGYVTFPWKDAHGDPLTLYGTWPARTPPDGVPKKMTLPNPKSGGEDWEQTKRSPLYFDRARRAGHKDLVAVEGVTDAAYLQSLGDTRVVAYVAAELSHSQVDTVKLHRMRSVTIVPDPDAGGDGGALSCVRQLRDAGITPYVAPRLPDGLDPDDFALAHGLDAWKAHVRQAIHGYRFVARSILARHGERQAGDDAWGDVVVEDALNFARSLPEDRAEEMSRHFWPEITAAVGGDAATLRGRVRPAGPVDTGGVPGQASASAPPGGAETPASAGGDGGWEEPLPLTVVPPAAAFPVGVFPTALQRFCRQAATAVGCPVDYIALPMLAIGGGALGASRALEVKKNFVQRPLLYAAIVGPPGDAKTPALTTVARPLQEAQHRLKAAYEAVLAKYEQDLEDYKARKNDDDPPPKPQKPVIGRVQVDDATVEAIGPILVTNPRGVVLVKDELTGWVHSQNQYKGGKGTDRQFWLSNWAGVPATIDRKQQQGVPLIIPHPYCAVVGGIQPDLLGDLVDVRGRADGFLDRPLFAYPDAAPAPAWTWDELDEADFEPWRATVEELLRLNMERGQYGPRPFFVRLEREARVTWQRLVDRLTREMNDPDFPPQLRGPWSKLKVYAARLSLIVHFFRWINQEAGGQDVDAESVERAGLLIEYFAGHVRKVLAVMGADPKVAAARHILGYLSRNRGLTRFTRTQLYRIARRSFPRPVDLDAPLALLAQHHYLRVQVPVRPPGGQGRPPAPEYEVNPRWDPADPGNNSPNSPNGSDSVNSVNCSGAEGEWADECDPGPDPFSEPAQAG